VSDAGPPGKPAPERASEKPAAARRRGRSAVVALSLVLAGLVLVLGFGPAARLAALGLPRLPPGPGREVAGSHQEATAVRDVPVGLPRGARIRTLADVLRYAEAALGPSGAPAFLAELRSSSLAASFPAGYLSGHLEYPYRYPALDTMLDKAPPASLASGATALGAALTVLAAQPSADASVTNAGRAAYSVLNRARADGGCAPQLDLFLLVAADENTSQDILRREEQRTQSACPHDPTPGWLLGQSQLRGLPLSASASSVLPAASVKALALTALHSAIAAFRHLAAAYPGDTGVLTGLGDAYLRAGTHLRLTQPFTARQDLRSAMEVYHRVSALGDARDAAPGLARALIALGEPAEAAQVLRPLTRASAFPGPSLEMLIAADEAVHDFRAAETAARHLDRLGTQAYPHGDALFPESAGDGIDALDDATLPLSFGAGRLTTLSTTLVFSGGAGGSVQDLSFIPRYRDDQGVTGTQPSCASWTWRRDAIINGQPAEALAGWPARSQFSSVRFAHVACPLAYDLRLIAQAEVSGQAAGDNPGIYDIADGTQNLLRWAGDLPAAEKTAERWQTATSALPALRLGEIDFLTHRYDAAAAEFGLAARRWRLLSWHDDLDTWQAQLDRGAALLAAGRTAEAAQLLRPLDALGTQGYAYETSLPNGQGADAALQFAAMSYYACEQLADHERESGDLHAAAEDYAAALDWTEQVGKGPGIRPEVLDSNAALAYLGLGEMGTAAGLENRALAADPVDPVFLMSAGFIADRAGRVEEAARYDRQALDSDPGAFPAAGDLGVELTREHHDGAAVTALRQAVGASPAYALGWFNLGVLESRLGPSRLLASQGAFAAAYSLDPALKDRRPGMTIDARVYRTALDLSKPLPPRWSISQLQRPAPAAAVGLAAIVLLGFGLARATGQGGSAVAGQWLDPISERLRSARWPQRLSHPGWALAATITTFLLAYLRRAPDPVEVVAYAVGVLILAAAAMAARSALASHRGIRIAQSSWPPAVVLGLVTGAFGLPWAPLPVVQADGKDNSRLHLAAPLTLAALSLLLFAESAWLHTPLTQAWAVASLIMSASMLPPIGPLDGAHVGKAGIAAGVGVAGGALLVGLGLI
jgi:tetratricopeptide (TPR) repeat protein